MILVDSEQLFYVQSINFILIGNYESFVQSIYGKNNLGKNKIFLDFCCYSIYALFVATN